MGTCRRSHYSMVIRCVSPQHLISTAIVCHSGKCGNEEQGLMQIYLLVRSDSLLVKLRILLVPSDLCLLIPSFVDSINHSTPFQEYIPCARCGIRFKKNGIQHGFTPETQTCSPHSVALRVSRLAPCVAGSCSAFQHIWGLMWRSWGKVGETLFYVI